jgi:hypothetical protein
MEMNEQLLSDIKQIADQIQDLRDLAYAQYSRAVDAILAGRMTDRKQVEQLLDGLLDFCDEPRFLELTKKLCRHIYYKYPELVGDFVNMFRLMFEEKEEGSDNGGDDKP